MTAIIWNQSLYPIRHYFPDIRANRRLGCWKQLPLPVPHCWQYRRRLESIATVCIMIADPSLEVCVPRHLSRLWGRSTAIRQLHRVRAGTHLPSLLGLRQGQLYVAGDSDIRLSRCRKGGREGFFIPLYKNNAKNPKSSRKNLNLAKYFFQTVECKSNFQFARFTSGFQKALQD